MDELTDLKLQILALRNVTALIWSELIIQTAKPDLAAETRRIAETSLQAIEGLFASNVDQTITHLLVHHEETFWRNVEERVTLTPRPQNPA